MAGPYRDVVLLDEKPPVPRIEALGFVYLVLRENALKLVALKHLLPLRLKLRIFQGVGL